MLYATCHSCFCYVLVENAALLAADDFQFIRDIFG
jgi:hypothetical protein